MYVAIRNYKGDEGMILKGTPVKRPNKTQIKLGLVITEAEYNKEYKEAKKRSDALAKEAKEIALVTKDADEKVEVLTEQLTQVTDVKNQLEAANFALNNEVKRLTELLNSLQPEETPTSEPEETPTSEPEETPTSEPEETPKRTRRRNK